MGRDQGIKFQEIEISVFHEIKTIHKIVQEIEIRFLTYPVTLTKEALISFTFL